LQVPRVLKKTVPVQFIATVGDMHVGHVLSIRPDHLNFEMRSGGEYPPLGKTGKYLLQCFDDFTSKVLNLKGSYALVLMGDLIQGHRKCWTTELVIPDMLDQARACIQLLKPIADKAQKKFLVEGTPFHDMEYSSHELEIADRLGADAAGVEINLRLSKFGNKVVNFVHGGSQAMAYRTTVLEREMLFSAGASEQGLYPQVHTIVRAHTHFALEVGYPGTKQAFICPCWQLPIKYIAKTSVFRLQPKIGSVIIGPRRDLKGNPNGDIQAYWDCIYPAMRDLHKVYTV